jgi:hypothetical protein
MTAVKLVTDRLPRFHLHWSRAQILLVMGFFRFLYLVFLPRPGAAVTSTSESRVKQPSGKQLPLRVGRFEVGHHALQ